MRGATQRSAPSRGVDLAVLAVKADAALDTARDVAAALGETPLLSVASDLTFAPGGCRPDPDARSLAERVQDLVAGPVVAGLHSIAASNLGEAPDEDALVCGDDPAAKELALDARSEARRRAIARRRPSRGRPHPRGADRRHRQPEPPLPRPRRDRSHRDPARVIEILPVEGLPEIQEGDDLGALVASAASLEAGDVVVVAQKAVSKAEGRVVTLDEVEPSERARELAGSETDVRQLEVILRETVRIVRSRGGLIIAETHHGFVCASAGVDHSNVAEAGTVILLPVDPDESARRIRSAISEQARVDVAVIVTDSFGRPFRQGTTDVAIGVAGLAPLRDLRGTRDRAGKSLRTTQVAVADELAAAANLVRTTKADGIPVVIIRGHRVTGDGIATDLVIPAGRDLFR